MDGNSIIASNSFFLSLGYMLVELISFQANKSRSSAPLLYNNYQDDKTSIVAGSCDGVDHGLNQMCEAIALAMYLTAVLDSVS